MTCGRDGTWQAVEFACAVPIFPSEGLKDRVYWLGDEMVWTLASELVHLYSYNGMVGQLAVIRSQTENAFLYSLMRSVGAASFLLAGAHNDDIQDVGIYWSSAPFYGQMFFNGTSPSGFAVSPFYTNFSATQPNNQSSIMVLDDTGHWWVVFSFLAVCLH
jgi:hypothetical protein